MVYARGARGRISCSALTITVLTCGGECEAERKVESTHVSLLTCKAVGEEIHLQVGSIGTDTLE